MYKTFLTLALCLVVTAWSARADIMAPSVGDNNAWTTYSPTITTSGGTITTLDVVTGRYKQIGKTVFIQLSIPIITNGTGSGYVISTLPVTAKSGFSFPLSGIDDGVGAALVGNIPYTDNTKVRIFKASDMSYPGANGVRIELNGSYEAN